MEIQGKILESKIVDRTGGELLLIVSNKGIEVLYTILIINKRTNFYEVLMETTQYGLARRSFQHVLEAEENADTDGTRVYL